MDPNGFEYIQGFSYWAVGILTAIGTLIGAGFGAGITWTTLRGKVHQSASALEDVKAEIKDLKLKIETLEDELRATREAEVKRVRELERALSAPISQLPKTYVLANHCVKIRNDLAKQFCSKVDEVKGDILDLKNIIADMNRMREEARIEFAELTATLKAKAA